MSWWRSIFGKTWVQAMAVALASFAVLFVHYGALLRSPGAHLFSGTGDGLKNYYAFAYHVVHDGSLMQFEGMNHPFGEQIGYPDAQPALSGALQLVARVFPSVGFHSVAVVNAFCLLSMVLTALSIYLLLRHFKVNWLYAGLCGIALAALSPQTFRLQAGHHGLSYGWPIVLVIYFLLRILHSRAPLWWTVGGSYMILVSFYLHPYTGMIAVMWAGFLLLLLAPHSIKSGDCINLIHAVGLLVAPIVLFLLIQHLTDHHVGRARYPLGFFEYVTNWAGVLSPPTYCRSALSWALFPWNMKQEFEASAYIGIGAMLGVLVLVPVIAIRWARNAPVEREIQRWPWTITAMVLACVPLMAFAFGLPFSEAHGPYPWSLPFVGQFRSPGRFAWAGYYAFGMGVMYGAWWCRENSSGLTAKAATVFAILVPGLYLYEGHVMHMQISQGISSSRNVLSREGLNAEERLVLATIDPDEYRAIVPIPFFLAGSDELLLLPTDHALHLSMVVSYWTGLPITAHMMSRPSVTETREQIGMLTSPWYDRSIAARYDPQDRFLMLLSDEPKNEDEARYMDLAEPVAKVGPVRLASITAAELFKNRKEELFTALEKLQADSLDGGWFSTSKGARVHYFPLDERPVEHIYHGTGAHTGLKRNVNTLATVPAYSLNEGERYIVTYWAYNRGHLRSHALTCVAQRDPTSGKEDWISCGDIRFARVVNGDWSLVELPFTANKDEHEYRIFTEGKKLYMDSIWCDEVLVRPADAETFKVLKQDGGRFSEVIYNGHLLKRP